jgi:hypothetical protein
MTATIGSTTTAQVMRLITGVGGLNSSLAALTQADQALAGPLDMAQVRAQNVAAELAERSSMVKYPVVHVYCEKVTNRLTEKFRTFSGTAQMTIEIRHSQDRLEGLQDSLQLYTDAATQVLAVNRGDWGDGMFYGGGYEASFGAVKQGGKNFIQVAKVTFEIGVSKN